MRSLVLLMFAITLGLIQVASAQSDVAAKPTEGLRDNRPQKFALTNARVVVQPGQVIANATVLIQDTAIIKVAEQASIPAGFLTIDCSGQTIYPGLIDAYSELEVPRPNENESGHWNSNVTPQRSAHVVVDEAKKEFEKTRSQGITVRVVAPEHGIIKGSSSIVLAGDTDSGRLLMRSAPWQHVSLTVPKNRPRSSYPNSPMGAVALLRQTLYDATWYGDAWRAYRANPILPRPETNLALASLQNTITNQTFIVDAPNERMALRADAIAKEFSLSIALRGSGREYRDLDAIVAAGHPILLPVKFADKPKVSDAAAARNVSLQELMHWDLAPENPGRLAAQGAVICLTTDGLENVKDFLKQVRLAVSRGLDPDTALAAMTTTPAKLLTIDDSVGQVRAGMLANLVITDGDLFDKKTKVLETWVAGKQFRISPPKPKSSDSLIGRWLLTFDAGDSQVEAHLNISQKGEKLAGQLAKILATGQDGDTEEVAEKNDTDEDEDTDDADAVAESDTDAEKASAESSKAKSAELKQIVRQKDRLQASVRLSDLSDAFESGISQLSIISVDEGDDVMTAFGSIRLPDGETQTLKIAFVDPEADDKTDSEKDTKKPDEDPDESLASHTPLLYPLGAHGRSEPIAAATTVLFRNATVWTCGEEGILDSADVLIRDGKFVSVGRKLAVPDGCTVINANGKHLTPGLIDCHSHMATDGGVNESGQAVTAEVRIGDFIDHTDITIYRQLAGGVTTSNILHGSANPIGGQNQVIKLRWGQGMNDLRMTQAPAGIKFALGENVKRNQSRYPNTRMGVEQLMRDQLLAAREYDRAKRDYRNGKRDGLPPRRDLQLDAMSEVQRGERWIHCHSYRQDEIVATLDLLEEFGIRIGTLQHILEGYKVADRMKRHGAMASSFSDWWAYKFEVFDAIPYNGALMHDQGIVVSFNSDDRELARHLNTEAAKAMKYGGVSAQEALKFVTLNPAKQLRIDEFVGSVEPGKHADLVIWSGPPMSTTTRCEQTWIDGRKLFDLESDRQMRERDGRLHATLVQKILDDKSPSKSDTKSKDVDEEDRWARHDVYCTATGQNYHNHTQSERRQ
ncbi:amidohydrolase family protein [Planctomycetes bacterium K23_9]|uniref:Imidazolonepropionase n=1 Tax=Stieleria marina TaxID=1930275 RepID=A0A517P391_9BACT|nr:imidazolonepropionase [Planctomycetes bacterium K23_9]